MECCFLGQNWEDCEARWEVLVRSYLDREGTELWREGMTIKPSLPPLASVPNLAEYLAENVSWFKVYFHAHSMQKSPHPLLKNKNTFTKGLPCSRPTVYRMMVS